MRTHIRIGFSRACGTFLASPERHWYTEDMRVPASTIFSVNMNGTVTITKPTKIGGVKLPGNLIFSKGVRIGQRDLTTLVGKDLEVEKEGDTYTVKGVYEQQ